MTNKSNSLAGPLLASYGEFWKLNPETRSAALRAWLQNHTIAGGAGGAGTDPNPSAVRGGTTAPASTQVVNCVIADVTMADASTATTIFHSLSGVSTNGLDGSPFVQYVCLTAGATPVGMGLVFTFSTNSLIVTNAGGSAAGNGSTYRVQIWRHSLITNYTI